MEISINSVIPTLNSVCSKDDEFYLLSDLRFAQEFLVYVAAVKIILIMNVLPLSKTYKTNLENETQSTCKRKESNK